MYLEKNWSEYSVSSTINLFEALKKLNQTAKRLLIVEDDGKFIGVCNDGDIRRGILNGLDLDEKLSGCVQRAPFVATSTTPLSSVLYQIEENGVQAVPLIEDQAVVGVYFQHTSVSNLQASLVIMAGGRGTRMLPHTKSRPKPMLHVGGKPMLEHLIEDAKRQGIRKVIISVGFMGDTIEEYFGDGKSFGLEILYINENEPMGTFGALTTIDQPKDIFGEHFFLRNGDVLARCLYRDLLFKLEAENGDFVLTGREHVIENPYGVFLHNNYSFQGLDEKPVHRSLVNAGIYLFKTKSLELVSKNVYLDATDFINLLSKQKQRGFIVSIDGPWMDVGRPDDLETAQSDFSEGI